MVPNRVDGKLIATSKEERVKWKGFFVWKGNRSYLLFTFHAGKMFTMIRTLSRNRDTHSTNDSKDLKCTQKNIGQDL